MTRSTYKTRSEGKETMGVCSYTDTLREDARGPVSGGRVWSDADINKSLPQIFRCHPELEQAGKDPP